MLVNQYSDETQVKNILCSTTAETEQQRKGESGLKQEKKQEKQKPKKTKQNFLLQCHRRIGHSVNDTLYVVASTSTP